MSTDELDDMTSRFAVLDEDPYRVVDRDDDGTHTTVQTYRARDEADWQAQLLNAQHARTVSDVLDLLAPLQRDDVSWATWETTRDPVDGSVRPTTVAAREARGGDVDLYVKRPTNHGSGHSWFRVGPLSTDRVASIAPPPRDLHRELARRRALMPPGTTTHRPEEFSKALASHLADRIPNHRPRALEKSIGNAIRTGRGHTTQEAVQTAFLNALPPAARRELLRPDGSGAEIVEHAVGIARTPTHGVAVSRSVDDRQASIDRGPTR